MLIMYQYNGTYSTKIFKSSINVEYIPIYWYVRVEILENRENCENCTNIMALVLLSSLHVSCQSFSTWLVTFD